MFRLFMYSFIFTQIAASAGANSAPVMLYTGIFIAYFLMTRWYPVFPYVKPPINDNGEE
jgi:hypothetical protein